MFVSKNNTIYLIDILINNKKKKKRKKKKKKKKERNNTKNSLKLQPNLLNLYIYRLVKEVQGGTFLAVNLLKFRFA